jgi:transcription elongation factor Elf1
VKSHRHRRRRVSRDAAYTCDSCGEEIVIPVDISQGRSQEYVEDCPVCCHANVIHVEIDERQEVRVWAESE